MPTTKTKEINPLFKLIAASILCLLIFWIGAPFFVPVFAGIIVAIFLLATSGLLRSFTRMGAGWALLITLVVLISLFVALGVWMGPAIADQATKLSQSLPAAITHVEESVSSLIGTNVEFEMPADFFSRPGGIFKRITTAISVTFGILGTLAIIFFTGLFLAAQPTTYVRGFLHIIPKPLRSRTEKILEVTGDSLKRWLIGRLIDMVVVGITIGIGLWLIGVPLALLLAIIAGLLTFIPYIGPLISAVPAILVGFTISTKTALWIALLYGSVQLIESYLLEPIIGKKAVSIPPALLLTGQVLVGLLAGIEGVIIASPLVVSAFIFIREIYVKDLLDDRSI